VRNHSNLLVSVSDKSSIRGGPGAASGQSGYNRGRSGKDEPKIPIIYTLRNPSALGTVAEGNPESEANGGVELIDASGAKPETHEVIRKGRIEIVAYAKLKQLR
jgi:hypothetical protein